MNDNIRKLVEKSNRFLQHLADAQELWGELQEEISVTNSRLFEEAPLQFQELANNFGMMEFFTLIPRFSEYCKNNYRGFDGLVSKLEEEESNNLED